MDIFGDGKPTAYPLLANIYLHELDLFMAEMRAGVDRGAKRRPFPRYVALERCIMRLRQKIDTLRATNAEGIAIRECLQRIRTVAAERLTVPSVDGRPLPGLEPEMLQLPELQDAGLVPDHVGDGIEAGRAVPTETAAPARGAPE